MPNFRCSQNIRTEKTNANPVLGVCSSCDAVAFISQFPVQCGLVALAWLLPVRISAVAVKV